MLGGGPLDEDQFPPDENSHPLTDIEHFHHNHNVHMVGPFPHHAIQEAPNANPLAELEHPIEDDPAWGHWAMPPLPR